MGRQICVFPGGFSQYRDCSIATLKSFMSEGICLVSRFLQRLVWAQRKSTNKKDKQAISRGVTACVDSKET
jgi:hypothetical protein